MSNLRGLNVEPGSRRIKSIEGNTPRSITFGFGPTGNGAEPAHVLLKVSGDGQILRGSSSINRVDVPIASKISVQISTLTM